MILFLNNQLPFGKYHGNRVKDTIDNDLQYMIWFRDNVKVSLADETLKYIEDHINDEAYNANLPDPNSYSSQ